MVQYCSDASVFGLEIKVGATQGKEVFMSHTSITYIFGVRSH